MQGGEGGLGQSDSPSLPGRVKKGNDRAVSETKTFWSDLHGQKGTGMDTVSVAE